MSKPLVDGLYEDVLTEGLAAAVDSLAEARSTSMQALDPADSANALTRHFAVVLARTLESIPESKRPAAQVQIVNQLLSVLGTLAPGARDACDGEGVREPGTQLLSVHRGVAAPRPKTPLGTTTLLTRNRNEPNLGVELAHEIESADRIDMLIAFVTVGGVRVLRDALTSFTRKHGAGQAPTLRLLTTVYSRTTELQALDMLARLPGVEVKVSYDVNHTRLHAKAWLLHRNSGLHTAYIGSANLTHTALGAGHEWMVRISAADQRSVIDKFAQTFDTLWNDAEFEPFDPTSESARARLSDALRVPDSPTAVTLFAPRPYPFQEEILDRLEAERTLHGRLRNLVVAATGTGKTLIAAFDYQRQVARTGITPSLLFVAHRKEILQQAREVFRHVLSEGSFGELLGDGDEPQKWTHVFATVQSAARRDVARRFGADHFRYVVIDECHHAPADSYRALLTQLKPEILLGLTATPERSDGRSLLADFDGHIAAELRIWHALERQLLVPFEYFGLGDQTDLRSVKWERSGYSTSSLSKLYTGNEARVDLIVTQLRNRVSDVRAVRALAFCVSVEHAEFMATALAARGVPAIAVHGASPDEVRDDIRRRLREREVNVVCTCDLYNEGIDLPFVDTLLFLRPTSSPTLFLQQLGRGLRLFPNKASCLVLDFIGQHRIEFRFDALYGALTGVARGELAGQVEQGFPLLPSGCVLQLDAVARQHVLDSIRNQIVGRTRLLNELRRLHDAGGATTLREFLEETGFDLEDVYRGGSGGFAALKRAAGIIPGKDEAADALSAQFGRLLHADEPARLKLWSSLANHSKLSGLDRKRVTMLEFQLKRFEKLQVAEKAIRYLTRDEAVRDELVQLSEVLSERIPLAHVYYPVEEWPLALHRHYSRQEILAAVGQVVPGGKQGIPAKGILKIGSDRELLFVTLNKSSKAFSPTTRYRDHAISRQLFHWETPSIASVDKPSGRRYLESPRTGYRLYLFVRTDTDAPFAFVGPVHYVSHEGDRPIAITWRLETPLPAVLYQRYATLQI